MPAKPKPVRVIAAELGMSLGHVQAAMKAGIDPHNRRAMKKYKAGLTPRVDSRSDLTKPPRAGPSVEMSLDEIESSLKRKDISVSEATTLKRQLEGLKLGATIRRANGQLLSRQQVEERDTRIGAAVSAALRVLENEIPQLLLGLPLERSRPVTKDKTRAVQAMLADEFSAFWKENPET